MKADALIKSDRGRKYFEKEIFGYSLSSSCHEKALVLLQRSPVRNCAFFVSDFDHEYCNRRGQSNVVPYDLCACG